VTPRAKALAVALPLAGALLLLLGARTMVSTEPRYHGQPLSYWIEQYRVGSTTMIGNSGVEPSQLIESREAIRAIGTNAVTSLVKWMRYQAPIWGTRFMPWAPLPLQNKVDQALFSHERANRGEAAMEALEFLGTNATAAIPALMALALKTQGNLYIAMRATRAMCQLGPEAFPAMINVWSNAPPTERPFVSMIIGQFFLPTLRGRENLPFLLQRMQARDSLRSLAAEAIARIAPDLLTNEPAR
jgi:hypothetical protein